MKTTAIVLGSFLVTMGLAVVFIHDRGISNSITTVFVSFEPAFRIVALAWVLLGALLLLYGLLSKRS